MCTFRANCYSTCLLWVLVLTKKSGVWFGRRVGYLTTTFALKALLPSITDSENKKIINGIWTQINIFM